ncbi:uncharacterized protein LOC144377293 [Ictidomys tridecemlineatus]
MDTTVKFHPNSVGREKDSEASPGARQKVCHNQLTMSGFGWKRVTCFLEATCPAVKSITIDSIWKRRNSARAAPLPAQQQDMRVPVASWICQCSMMRPFIFSYSRSKNIIITDLRECLQWLRSGFWEPCTF